VLVIGKILLGPILLLQGRRVRGAALRLPEAAGLRTGVEGAAFEGAPLHILVVGDSSAAGVGVEMQEQALAQPLAQALSEHLGRPVAWQLLAKSGIETTEALALLEADAPQPADVLITALGVNDVTGQHSPARFIGDYRRLHDTVRSRRGITLFVANGLPPMHLLPALPQPLRWYLGQCAFRLDRALQDWVGTMPDARYLSLHWGEGGDVARDGFHPGPVQYRRWAGKLASTIAEAFNKQSGMTMPK
jgi:lysophospholipase L1-like esterase